jgi:hypothetical protein
MSSDKHEHKFNKKDTIRVSLHDERERAANKHLLEMVGDNRTGAMVAKDSLKVWRCSIGSCEAYKAYDLERMVV